MTKAQEESEFINRLVNIAKDLFQEDVDTTTRALILADTVSYEIWGGARGWEKATDAQFKGLVQGLKEILRDGTKNPTTPAQEEDVSQDEAKQRCCDDYNG